MATTNPDSLTGNLAAGVVEGYPAGDVARWYRTPLMARDTEP